MVEVFKTITQFGIHYIVPEKPCHISSSKGKIASCVHMDRECVVSKKWACMDKRGEVSSPQGGDLVVHVDLPVAKS